MRCCRLLLPPLLLLAATAQAQREAEVLHEVSFPQRHNQYLRVSATWPVTGNELQLAMPSWTPGSYKIRDFAAHVEGMQAVDASGRSRAIEKTSKNRWRIDSEGASALTVSYDVWAGELNVATSWVEADFALLNGAGIFLYNEASRQLPQRLRLALPETWSGVETPLPSSPDGAGFLARDFDELVDSPIVAGNPVRYPFSVRGTSYALVEATPNPLWDGPRARDDTARIVEAHQAFWGVDPFEREYLFLNFFTGPFGGLEHDHGTVLMFGLDQMTARPDYIKWLGLVSHEFFHAWNVRRMRPAALAQYDYDREMYTRELWLAEGLSSYYDDLLLFRSGLIDVPDYFELLAQEIRNYETMPGRTVRSAERASFDTWIKQYQPNENSINSTVSYYRKGAVIGLVTDQAIRQQTGNRASLDSVMRRMYERYGPGGPGGGAYPAGAFGELIGEIAGDGLRRFVEDLLRTTDDPDVDAALEWYGLQLERAPASPDAGSAEQRTPGGLGVNWYTVDGSVRAEQVILGHAGANGGLLPGDELIAIDGVRVTAANHAARIQRLQPGQQVQLTVVRHERLLTLEVEVQAGIPLRYAIVTKSRLRRVEKERLEAWLGRELRFVD
jgi:predicted metalloprotease with PDZ domain